MYKRNVTIALFLLNFPNEKTIPIITDKSKRKIKEMINSSELNIES